MYLRFIRITTREEPLKGFYHDRVLPTLEHTEGCLFAGLLKASSAGDDFLSVTLWREKEHAERYVQSGDYDRFLDAFEEALGVVEAGPEPGGGDGPATVAVPDPPVETYTVELSHGLDALLADHGTRAPHARVVSLHVAGGQFDELRRRYERDIIPALEAAAGCRAALLVEGERNRLRALSVTLWESEVAARIYEASGEFDRLTETLSDCLSPLYRWGEGTTREGGEIRSGLHMAISHYDMVVARRYRL